MVAGTDYGHNDIGSELAVHSAIRSRSDIADTSARNIVDTNARRLCGVPDTFRPAPEIKNNPAVFDLPHVHSASTGDRGALVTSPRQRPARSRSTTKSQAAAGARLPRYFRSGLRHLVIHVGPVGLPCSLRVSAMALLIQSLHQRRRQGRGNHICHRNPCPGRYRICPPRSDNLRRAGNFVARSRAQRTRTPSCGDSCD